MNFQERLHKFDRLHHLILRKGTGTPTQLANRLGVCKRTAHNLIDELRNLGAPIAYCSTRESYYYEYDIVLQLLPKTKQDINSVVLPDANGIKGGGKKFTFLSTMHVWCIEGGDIGS